MTLLDKSLKLALLASVALLTACPTTDADKDTSETDADTDADSDTDTDTDTDTDVDTGLTQFYFVGAFETSGGDYVDASFGYGFYGLEADDWLCRVTGTLAYEGEAPAACPECDWSFDLSGATNSTAVGDYCAQFSIEDGYLDGYIDYSWGFASTYYYDYNGTPLPLTNAVMLYIDYWFTFAFNYGGRDWVFGDAESSTLERPVISGGSYVYYFYYPY